VSESGGETVTARVTRTMPETMAKRQSRWQAIGGESQPTEQVTHWQERRERLLADSETTEAIGESLVGARCQWLSQSR
jgi:hypothetical protein